jgi:hypothetical protein
MQYSSSCGIAALSCRGYGTSKWEMSCCRPKSGGRIGFGDIATRLELIARLPITVDAETTTRAWRDILMLARDERLTTYDAAYLELALRRGVPLATKDEALCGAARRLGVAILPDGKVPGS